MADPKPWTEADYRQAMAAKSGVSLETISTGFVRPTFALPEAAAAFSARQTSFGVPPPAAVTAHEPIAPPVVIPPAALANGKTGEPFPTPTGTPGGGPKPRPKAPPEPPQYSNVAPLLGEDFDTRRLGVAPVFSNLLTKKG